MAMPPNTLKPNQTGEEGAQQLDAEHTKPPTPSENLTNPEQDTKPPDLQRGGTLTRPRALTTTEKTNLEKWKT